ncbi:MAG: DNA repair protein RecN, partial [Microcystaceae cyanobacterium]
QLGQAQQVLCVTHQPLVAALADQHFRVDKTVIGEAKNSKNLSTDQQDSELRTVVRLTTLTTSEARQQELAQLAGGNSAQEALTFAKSLLEKAAIYRAKNS